MSDPSLENTKAGDRFTDSYGEWTSLGSGVAYALTQDASGQVIGLLERHVCAEGQPSPGIGSVPFNNPAGLAAWPESYPHWQVSSLDPLTIHPSVLCRTCGLHGWIRNGVWMPC